MTFEEHRAYVSHSLLENGFFCYLAEPPDLWKDARSLEEFSLRALCMSWIEVAKKPRLIRHAIVTWKGNRPGEAGIPIAVLDLYDQCRKGRHFQPRASFPSREVIMFWLDRINTFIEMIDSDSRDWNHISDRALDDFWRAGLTLYDFVQGIRVGGPRFWDYFEPIR